MKIDLSDADIYVLKTAMTEYINYLENDPIEKDFARRTNCLQKWIGLIREIITELENEQD